MGEAMNEAARNPEILEWLSTQCAQAHMEITAEGISWIIGLFLKRADALSAQPAPQPSADIERDSAALILARLREEGWSVAIHNDYRLHGKPHTFWLLTHPSGVWAKGEGATDQAALHEVRSAISSQTSPQGKQNK